LTLNATELQIWRREPRTATLYRNLYHCDSNRKPPNLEAGRRDADLVAQGTRQPPWREVNPGVATGGWRPRRWRGGGQGCQI
jgi:hypothetical protein